MVGQTWDRKAVILITGDERDLGKELIAEAIHAASPRARLRSCALTAQR